MIKKIISGVLVFILAVSMVACNKDDDSKKTKTKGNFVSEYGYSMNLPDGWEETNTPGALEAYIDEDGNNFIFATTPSDASFDDADEEYFKEAYSMLGESVKFTSYEKIKIDGNKGHRIEITNKVSDDMTAIQTQVYLDVDDTVFLFTFTDMDSSNQDTIKGIIDSISID